MKKHLTLGALAATTLIAFATPTFAQTAGTGGAERNYATENRDDGRDWGWIGLLGLIGLAGLKGRDRHHHDDVRRNTNMPGRA